MQTLNQSWREQVMDRLRTSADDGFELLSFDMIRVLLSLLLGLIGGLALGLFLGWVVWPVQWSSAWPSDLEVDAKSQYIAAVADAYVATQGDAYAFETARMRLINMTEEDFTIAQRYFANIQPGQAVQATDENDVSIYQLYAEQRGISLESNVRLNNINQLAADLGVVIEPTTLTDSTLGETDAAQPQAQPAAADGAAQDTVNQSTVDQSNDANVGVVAPSTGFFNGNLGSAIACLTALMLVFGGVYILVRLNQRMDWIKRPLMRGQNGGDSDSGWDDPWEDDLPEQPERDGEWINPGMGRQTVRSNAGSQRQAEWYQQPLEPERVDENTEFPSPSFDDEDERYAEVGPQDALGFDDEPRDVVRRTDIPATPLSARGLNEVGASPAHDNLFDRQDAYDATEEAMPDYGHSLDYVSPPSFEDEDYPSALSSSTPSSVPSSVGAAQPEEFSRPLRTSSSGKDSMPTRPARTRRTVLDFTTQYRRGESNDYEEKHQILVEGDGVENYGRNIGECGMGVNFKNGILLNNPHDVIALDLWLLDKAKLENLTSIKRILISEYVVERQLEEVIQRENHSDGSPIVPQPGTEFELQGAKLSATCRVLEASYIQEGELKGVFNSLVVHVTVYAAA